MKTTNEQLVKTWASMSYDEKVETIADCIEDADVADGPIYLRYMVKQKHIIASRYSDVPRLEVEAVSMDSLTELFGADYWFGDNYNDDAERIVSWMNEQSNETE